MEENNRGGKEFRRGFLWGITAMVVLAALVFAAGRIENRLGSGTAERTVSDSGTARKLETLAEIIDSLYYEEADSEKIEEGIYRGLFDSLGDPYSQYYNAEEYQSLMDSTTGSYYGIGAILSQDRETMQVTVLHVYKGSPAEEAGVRDGDVILAVDGAEAGTEELSELVKRIKGAEGTAVSLTLQREGVDKSLIVQVERRQVQVPTVEYQMLENNTGYLQISEFSDVTPDQFKKAVEDLEADGMTSLIVDLRDNPGGVLDAVNKILDQILPEGIIVYTEDKNGSRTDYTSDGDTYMDIPLAVLINENSASASEIFAGAIKDYEYGILIGTTTFGKGIVQQIIPLRDKSAAKVTIARYFTPKGNYIHEVGIEPDIRLEYDYLGPEDEEYDIMQDNQVLKALEVLRNRQEDNEYAGRK